MLGWGGVGGKWGEGLKDYSSTFHAIFFNKERHIAKAHKSFGGEALYFEFVSDTNVLSAEYSQ